MKASDAETRNDTIALSFFLLIPLVMLTSENRSEMPYSMVVVTGVVLVSALD